MKRPILLSVGGEKRGLKRDILEKCEGNIRIEYQRKFNEALSAASATAIMCFEIARQNS